MAAIAFGPAERPVDLVFSHANGFNARTYARLLGPLAARYHILAIDMRGHGLTTLPADPARHPGWKIFADDLLTRPMSLTHVLASAWRYLPQLRGPLAQELERAFDDVDMRAAMSAVTLYTGLAPERTPIFPPSNRRRSG